MHLNDASISETTAPDLKLGDPTNADLCSGKQENLVEFRAQPPKYTASSSRVTVIKSEPPRPVQIGRKPFWHDDGNVVIHVEERLFRVHMTVLRDESPFFAKLFAVNTHANEAVDGCDVYRLDGRACDFAALLDGLYGKLTRLVGKEPSFFTLACLLRASHHWEISSLRAWALQALKKRWPPTLDQLYNQDDLTEHATKVIVLFRECRETCLLKRAFYRLLSVEGLGLRPVDITGGEATSKVRSLEEYDHRDTFQKSAAELPPPLVACDWDWVEADSELARDDIFRIIRLHAHTTRVWRAFAYKPPSFFWLYDRLRHGIWPTCATKLDPIWHKRVTEASFSSQGGCDLLGCLMELKEIRWEALGICRACAADCRHRWEKEREDFWMKLDKEIGI